MKRFIVVVLDSFGIGAMDDVCEVRPQDIHANTAKHLLEYNKNIRWPRLLKLGLINALGEEVGEYKKSESAIFGKSKLAHFGGDTYFGHQEIMGTKPMEPLLNCFKEVIDVIQVDLNENGYRTRRFEKEGLALICVNEALFIGDNLETDQGQAINVTASFDLVSFEEIIKVGRIVRKHVQVSRVIVFGGVEVTFEDLVNSITVRGEYIGLDAPKSKVYRKGYQVLHIGYGVDTAMQVPAALHEKGILTYLYGKVADIVENPYGIMKPGVDTEGLFELLLEDLKKKESGFYCLNVQETDLAGHQCEPDIYIDRLNVSDEAIQKIIDEMNKEDILVIMADHGNDPTADSTKHSREYVPILIYKEGLSEINIGIRETMADVGATVAEYFGTEIPFGTSFLKEMA